VEGNERIEDAARRECCEEIGVNVQTMDTCGVLHFSFPNGEILEVHLFKVLEFLGEPRESEEMKPQWFHEKDIPYVSMWSDDIYWLPHALKGKKIQGTFFFGEHDAIKDYDLDVK
jgi:8-oxo-dGTP pyrophosphatase MutT (NUDIX family)